MLHEEPQVSIMLEMDKPVLRSTVITTTNNHINNNNWHIKNFYKFTNFKSNALNLIIRLLFSVYFDLFYSCCCGCSCAQVLGTKLMN